MTFGSPSVGAMLSREDSFRGRWSQTLSISFRCATEVGKDRRAGGERDLSGYEKPDGKKAREGKTKCDPENRVHHTITGCVQGSRGAAI